MSRSAHKTLCLPTTLLIGLGGVNLLANLLLGINYIKYPDLHRKSCLSTHDPHWSGGGMGGQFLRIFFLLGIEQQESRSVHKTHIHQLPTIIGGHWGSIYKNSFC